MARVALLFFLVACAGGVAAKEERPRGNPTYAAIAYHQASGAAGWATDRRSAKDAKVDALRQCGHENCVVVASVTRGCAALAEAPARKFTVQRGVTGQEAQTKALEKCGAGCKVAAWTCTTK